MSRKGPSSRGAKQTISLEKEETRALKRTLQSWKYNFKLFAYRWNTVTVSCMLFSGNFQIIFFYDKMLKSLTFMVGCSAPSGVWCFNRTKLQWIILEITERQESQNCNINKSFSAHSISYCFMTSGNPFRSIVSPIIKPNSRSLCIHFAGVGLWCMLKYPGRSFSLFIQTASGLRFYAPLITRNPHNARLKRNLWRVKLYNKSNGP